MEGFAIPLSEILRRKGDDKAEAPALPEPMQARVIRDIATELATPHAFKVGDLVKRRACSPYREQGVGIIVEVLEEPIFDEESGASSPYFRLKLDVVVAFMAAGSFCRYHQAGMYLEPYTGQVE